MDARGFVQHLQLYHEEVQYAAEDVPLACSKCSQEVVGAYYRSEDPGYPPLLLCMRCCWDEQIGTNQGEEGGPASGAGSLGGGELLEGSGCPAGEVGA